MELNDKQRIQAAKDIWRLMYERGIWRAELAIDTYRREAEERLAVQPPGPPGQFWYRFVCTWFLMWWCAFLAVMIGGQHPDHTRWFWELFSSGAVIGLVLAIMLWRREAKHG